MLYLLLLVPIAWFLQNIIHELSHLFVGWVVEGRKPIKMIPWPNKYLGRWYFARYENGPATKPGSSSFRHIAPLFFAVWVSLLTTALFILTDNLYCLPFWVCSIIDSVVWLYGYVFKRPGTDGLAYFLEE